MAKEKATSKALQPTRIRKSTSAPVSNGTGRRKKAIARVWMRRGGGSVIINGKDFKNYFDTDTMRLAVLKPLTVYPLSGSYDFTVNVYGGGKTGQSQAVRLGIARAILKSDESLRSALREHDLLTVDARNKERKKYGQKAARRKFQFVKR